MSRGRAYNRRISETKAKEGISCYFKEGISVAQNKFN